MGRPPGNSSVVLKDGLHIFLRSKIWWVYLKLDGQKKATRRTLKTGDIDTAKTRALAEYDDAQIRLKLGKPAGKTSFSKLATDYLVSMGTKGSKTYHADTIRRHLEPFFESRGDFSEITDSDVLDYVQWRRKKLTDKGEPPKDVTLNRENVVLRGIIGHAIKRGYLSKANAPVIDALSAKPNRRPAFTNDELSELLTVAERRVSEMKHAVHKRQRQLLYDWVVVMVNSGLRPDESRNLTWGEATLDGDKPKLHVPAGKSKRRKERDTYPMPAAIHRLKEMKARQEIQLKGIGKKLNSSDYIFSALKSDGLAQVGSFKNAFRALVDDCSFSRNKDDSYLSGESLNSP